METLYCVIEDYQSLNGLSIIEKECVTMQIVVFSGTLEECNDVFNQYTMEDPYILD